MKALGMGSLAHEVERSLRYAFSLPVSTVIVGMESVMQLEQNLKIAESYTPMTDAERLVFFRDILPLVRPEKMPWKTTSWEKPVEWIKRERVYRRSDI
jgi:predicted aldo/keto reductase-like oxidoreductase